MPSFLRSCHSSFPSPFNYQGATDGIQSSQDLIAVNCICTPKMHNQQRYFLIHNLLCDCFRLMHSYAGSQIGGGGKEVLCDCRRCFEHLLKCSDTRLAFSSMSFIFLLFGQCSLLMDWHALSFFSLSLLLPVCLTACVTLCRSPPLHVICKIRLCVCKACHVLEPHYRSPG